MSTAFHNNGSMSAMLAITRRNRPSVPELPAIDLRVPYESDYHLVFPRERQLGVLWVALIVCNKHDYPTPKGTTIFYREHPFVVALPTVRELLDPKLKDA